jgi:hypothetical protein
MVTSVHFRIWRNIEKRGNGLHIPTLGIKKKVGILHVADRYTPFRLLQGSMKEATNS